MKLIEGLTDSHLRRQLAHYLDDEGQREGDILHSPGPVILHCARPTEIWDLDPDDQPLRIFSRWLGYARGCEESILGISAQLQSQTHAAVYTDLGAEKHAAGVDVLSYAVHGPQLSAVWSCPRVDLGSVLAAPGLYLELLAATSGKQAAGVNRLVVFALSHLDVVNAVLNKPIEKFAPSPPIISLSLSLWLSELDTFLRVGSTAMGYKDPFFRRTAVPMHRAQLLIDAGRFEEATVVANTIAADCWRAHTLRWILKHSTPSSEVSS